MIVGVLGVLAVVCVLVAFSGAWLLSRLSGSGGLTIGVPTSTPRLAPTQRPTFPPPSTRPPAPTTTPTLAPPTPTTALEPTAQGGVELFSCTSADADCGWEAYSDEYGEAYAVGPDLFLVAHGPWALAGAKIPGVQVQDFRLSFIAKLSSSESGAGNYGAAFRMDPANEGTFYEFELRANGEWTVWKWVDFSPRDIASGTVELDPSGEDSVSVMADGPRLSFLVNGGPVTDITDAEVREGPIRFMATVLEEEAEIEVAISDVVVQEQGSPSPRPSSTTAPTAAPPSPTATRGPVEFDPIIFSTALDANFDPIAPGTSFPRGTTTIHAVWACRGMYQGLEVTAIWYHNGEQYWSNTRPWSIPDERGNWAFGIEHQNGSPLPSGNWRLELHAEGRLLQSGAFTIQ